VSESTTSAPWCEVVDVLVVEAVDVTGEVVFLQEGDCTSVGVLERFEAVFDPRFGLQQRLFLARGRGERVLDTLLAPDDRDVVGDGDVQALVVVACVSVLALVQLVAGAVVGLAFLALFVGLELAEQDGEPLGVAVLVVDHGRDRTRLLGVDSEGRSREVWSVREVGLEFALDVDELDTHPVGRRRRREVLEYRVDVGAPLREGGSSRRGGSDRHSDGAHEGSAGTVPHARWDTSPI